MSFPLTPCSSPSTGWLAQSFATEVSRQQPPRCEAAVAYLILQLALVSLAGVRSPRHAQRRALHGEGFLEDTLHHDVLDISSRPENAWHRSAKSREMAIASSPVSLQLLFRDITLFFRANAWKRIWKAMSGSLFFVSAGKC